MSVAPLVTPILFLGAGGDSPGEKLVDGCHRAIALDVLERLSEAGLAGAVLATSRLDVAEDMASLAQVTVDSASFHFGSRLRDIIREFSVSHPFYLSRGYGALMTASPLSKIAAELGASPNIVITNNGFSSDMVAFTPGQAMEAIPLPANDNALARLLNQEAGLPVMSLPRCAASLFDVDTPSDLWPLFRHPCVGHHTDSYLKSLDLDTSRLDHLLALFSDANAEVVVAGRISSFVWSRLEECTACRVRVLAEERGMKADGRDEAGAVRSILGFHLAEVGPRSFFRELAQLGQGAILDTRVIFSHLGLRPSAADRFHSDLGWWHLIQDPTVREFTQAAVEAPVPVLLGGHSMVSGGILALLEAAGLGKPALVFSFMEPFP